LQGLLGGLAEPQVELFGSIRRLSHIHILRALPDNVKTDIITV
jgi:hypothetical protein